MKSSIACLLLMLTLVNALVGCGSGGSSYSATPEPAAEPPAPRLEMTQNIMSEAKITAIDYSTRMMTIENKEGRSLTTKVAPEVANFERLKVGDVIEIEINESIVLEVSKEQTLGTTVSVSAEQGDKSLGAQEVINVRARVVSIDTATRQVLFELDDGTRHLLQVDKEDKDFELLKVDDVIEATITMAVTLAVRRNEG